MFSRRFSKGPLWLKIGLRQMKNMQYINTFWVFMKQRQVNARCYNDALYIYSSKKIYLFFKIITFFLGALLFDVDRVCLQIGRSNVTILYIYAHIWVMQWDMCAIVISINSGALFKVYIFILYVCWVRPSVLWLHLQFRYFFSSYLCYMRCLIRFIFVIHFIFLLYLLMLEIRLSTLPIFSMERKHKISLQPINSSDRINQ